MSEQRRLLRSASLVSVITLTSRVFGYLRDQRIAFLLGPVEADAYWMAYTIPNLLRRLVGEGAVSAAFIPIFSKYLSGNDRKDAWEFANAMLALATLVMALVTVIGILIAPLLVRIIAYGFETPGKVELTTLLTRIMFPYIFLVCLSALAMGVLNSFHKFAVPAFAPVLLNLSIITCSFVTGLFPSSEIALAVGVVIGGVAQLVIQVPQLRRTGWRIRPRLNLGHPGVRRAGLLMAPLVVSVGVVQVNVLVDKAFAAFLVDGSVFALSMSDRVMELVLGGYSIAIATVVLPMLSRNVAQGQLEEMRSTINFASRIILFITVPATVGLVILRVPIIQVLFEYGEFDEAATALTAFPLLFFALGLSAFSMMKIIVPAFYALQDTRTPVKVAVAAMVLNVAFNFAFFQPLQVGGPALATTLAAVFSVITLVIIFTRREGSLDMGSILASLGRFLIASTLMGVAAYRLINLDGFYHDQELLQRILALGTTIGLSAGVYFLAAYLLKCRELAEVREVFRKRRQGQIQ